MTTRNKAKLQPIKTKRRQIPHQFSQDPYLYSTYQQLCDFAPDEDFDEIPHRSIESFFPSDAPSPIRFEPTTRDRDYESQSQHESQSSNYSEISWQDVTRNFYPYEEPTPSGMDNPIEKSPTPSELDSNFDDVIIVSPSDSDTTLVSLTMQERELDDTLMQVFELTENPPAEITPELEQYAIQLRDQLDFSLSHLSQQQVDSAYQRVRHLRSHGPVDEIPLPRIPLEYQRK